MDSKFLLSSLKGRIRRWHWWIATLFITLVDYAISIPILWLLGGDPNYYWNDALPTKEVALADITAFLATLHFSLAVDIKRIHDRGRSAYLLVPLYLFSLALIFSQSLDWSQGIIWLLTSELKGTLPFEAYVLAAFFVIILTYSLWMLIELGFRKGTIGDNKYGPDPLQPLTPPSDETI
ncbi:MAG: DUF805 domain-containing protein [Hyphomicrobiaceae bacterium]|nr:DUF805 domain-containing protein [Hyphomicrobiaceae bacterium]